MRCEDEKAKQKSYGLPTGFFHLIHGQSLYVDWLGKFSETFTISTKKLE
jgi:hypothetical protein